VKVFCRRGEMIVWWGKGERRRGERARGVKKKSGEACTCDDLTWGWELACKMERTGRTDFLKRA